MIKQVFKGIAALILLFALAGCVHQTTEVKFVLPDDFHGEIQILDGQVAVTSGQASPQLSVAIH